MRKSCLGHCILIYEIINYFFFQIVMLYSHQSSRNIPLPLCIKDSTKTKRLLSKSKLLPRAPWVHANQTVSREFIALMIRESQYCVWNWENANDFTQETTHARPIVIAFCTPAISIDILIIKKIPDKIRLEKVTYNNSILYNYLKIIKCCQLNAVSRCKWVFSKS